MKTSIRNSFLLLLTALIWGVAFVAQTTGGDAVGPFSFCCIRSVIAVAALYPVVIFMDKSGLSSRKPESKEDKKVLWKGGIFCGFFLSMGTIFQQMGLYLGSEAGKAGFLTACYIIIVPILGVLVGKRFEKKVLLSVALAVIGLYLLCMTGAFGLKLSDVLVLICSLMYALQILTVDKYAPVVDVVRLSQIQFIVVSVISFVPMCIFEIALSEGGLFAWCANLCTLNAWVPLLYAGVLSSGVAYTLQNVGQQNMNPTIASLIMSLESVFSVIAGWLLLGQALSLRQIGGCALIFVAIVFAQLPMPVKAKS